MKQKRLKLAGFNVNSVRARLPMVLQWLREHHPDVLCLQETKVQDVDFPAEAFEAEGYKCAFRGQKAYNGVAILSSGEIRQVVSGFDTEPRDEARLMRARTGSVVVVNTYIPQGYMPQSEKFTYKLRWFARLREYFARHFVPGDPLIWTGDFNVAPEPRDVYDPRGLMGHVCFNQQVQQALRETMQWGFVDLFRMHCDQPGHYTFWDYRLRNSFRRNLGWRLDHIMATGPLAERCVRCYIDTAPRQAPRPSDHTVIVAEFQR